MAKEKRFYTLDDLVEIDRSKAPNLNLPAFEVEGFYMPKDGGPLMVYFLNVRRNWRPEEGCPYCGSNEHVVWDGRNKPRRIKDITRDNYCVQIITQSPRMYCKECDKRFNPKLDGIVQDGTMTERLVEFLKTESFLQPHSNLAERTGVSAQTIQLIMDKEIEKYEKEREDNPLIAPRVLGIDEKHINHVMRGTIVDVENHKLLDMLETNKEEDFKKAIMKLKDWDKNIEVVTTDMANSYLSWMPAFLPNATFVIDKFHVVQNMNRVVSLSKSPIYKYRKELIMQIEDDDERIRQDRILQLANKDKRLFNYSTENLARNGGKKAKDMDAIVNAFPEYALLRKYYTYLESLYAQKDRENAEKIWDAWQKELPPNRDKEYNKWCVTKVFNTECFNEFRKFTRSGHIYFKEYILNYFNPGCRYTNAATEGLNNLITTINTSGHGYSFRHLRAKALYASLIHERTIFEVDIHSITSWKPTFDYKSDARSGFTEKHETPIYRFREHIETCNITLESLQNVFLADSCEPVPEFIIEDSEIEYYFDSHIKKNKTLSDYLLSD